MPVERPPFLPGPRAAARALLRGMALATLFAAASTAQAETSVRVAPLAEVLVDLERRAPAEVLPLNDSMLAAEVNAVVAAVNADVGSTVRQGELLIQLDEVDFQLQFEAAEASLAAAEAQFADAEAKLDRARRLGREQYVSADELLTRETALALGDEELRRARSQIDVARRNLEKCRVLAPFDGVVQARQAQVGAYVTVGAPLLRLTQTDHIELSAEVPAAVATGLETAESVWFESRGQRWDVALLRLSPVVDPGRRSRQARFAFGDAAPAAGRSGQLAWREARGQLPANFLTRRGDALGVFIHEAGRAVFHRLPGAEEGRPALIELPGSTQVVVQGRDRLQDGDPIILR
ncbi:MAG: efflux RND transporter periplasmic adaptor subunit [Pseudomonadota bacterium]